MPKEHSGKTCDSVACPFCGLACDDLQVYAHKGAVKVLANGCHKSRARFDASDEKVPESAPAWIQGKPATLEQALAKAAEILRGATQPLFAGLGTDVAGMRAALRLADRTGAVVDHVNGDALFRNILALQDRGWISTTLSEVRNRVDLLVVAGTDIVSRFPRFFERCIWNEESMFGQETGSREVVFLGQGLMRVIDAPEIAGRATRIIACDSHRLGEIAGALRCLLANRPLQNSEVGGVAVDELTWLAQRMQRARYGVLTWAAADLDFPHAELAVESLCELIKDLNSHTRFSALPLGGSDGDITANQVCVWQSGFPVRTGFARGVPEYDPYRHATARMLASGAADAMFWISAFDPERTPPRCNVPTVVLGRWGMTFESDPDVYIPVGVPGLDHAGHFYRTDTVVAIRLRRLRESPYPAVADILTLIEQALPV